MDIQLKVNGQDQRLKVEPRALLADVLRDQLKLTGTHVGCDTSQCGCCTVLLDGQAVKSCSVLAAQADGSEVTTIEGLSDGQQLHPVQAAFTALLLFLYTSDHLFYPHFYQILQDLYYWNQHRFG